MEKPQVEYKMVYTIDIAEMNNNIEISDEEMLQVFLDAGIDKQILKEAGFYDTARYKPGVTKVVKYNAGYDIYLSQSTLKTIKSGGSTALAAVITKLVGAPFAPIFSPLLAKVINGVTPNPKGGMIFKLRIKKVYMGQYEGWVEMWVLDSYSYQ